MIAWMQALKDCDDGDVDNVGDAIGIEDEDLQLDCERAQMTEYPAQESDARSGGKDMIAAEGKTRHLTVMLLYLQD